MARSMWVGRDEHQGVRAQPRKDVPPPPHWRLEAVAATPRPHAVTVAADRRRAVFVQDADFSEVWLLDLEAEGAPERLTAGRELANWWESAPPRLSPDGSQVAYVDGEHVHVAPVAGGPARRLAAGDEPCWTDDRTLVITVERDDETRLAVVDVRDPWPRRLAADGAKGDESEAAVSPDGTEVAYTFVPRDDLARSEIRVASLRDGAWRALTGTPGLRDREPAWSPDGGRIAYASERSGFYELHLVGRDGSGDRPLTSAGADHGDQDWHPGGDRILAARTLRGRTDLVAVDAHTGEAELLAPGGQWSGAHWTADGGVIAAYEDHRTPPELRRLPPGGAPRTVHAPAPRPARARAARRARGGHLPLLRRARDPRVPAPPARRVGAPPGAGRGLPPRRADRLRGRHVGRRGAVLRRQGLRVARTELPRLRELRARVRVRQPRQLGRRRHAGLPGRGRAPAHARLGARRPDRRSSAPATAPTWRSARRRTTARGASAARSASTATPTSSRRGRRATAPACRSSR